MPWDKVLSLSISASVVSALFVPGRRELQPLEGVALSIPSRTLTKLGDGEESWIFVSDQPARFELQIRGGGATIRRPFIDVRVSLDAVPRHSLVLATGPGAASTDALDTLPGLAQAIPLPASAGQALGIQWIVDAAAEGVEALAGYVPVRERQVNRRAILSGGLQISPLGMADLARRLPDNPQDAERLAAIKAALEADRPLRERLALSTHEVLDSAVQHNGEQRCTVRTHFTAASAWLVTFGGIGPHGNPSTRQVTRVRLPVPRGISLEAV